MSWETLSKFLLLLSLNDYIMVVVLSCLNIDLHYGYGFIVFKYRFQSCSASGVCIMVEMGFVKVIFLVTRFIIILILMYMLRCIKAKIN